MGPSSSSRSAGPDSNQGNIINTIFDLLKWFITFIIGLPGMILGGSGQPTATAAQPEPQTSKNTETRANRGGNNELRRRPGGARLHDLKRDDENTSYNWKFYGTRSLNIYKVRKNICKMNGHRDPVICSTS